MSQLPDELQLQLRVSCRIICTCIYYVFVSHDDNDKETYLMTPTLVCVKLIVKLECVLSCGQRIKQEGRLLSSGR